MTSHERHILILFKALAEALKHVPGRRLDITVDDWALRRDFESVGRDSVKLLVTRSPDGMVEQYRFMRQDDYEKWCEEQRQPPKPPSRKMYLE